MSLIFRLIGYTRNPLYLRIELEEQRSTAPSACSENQKKDRSGAPENSEIRSASRSAAPKYDENRGRNARSEILPTFYNLKTSSIKRVQLNKISKKRYRIRESFLLDQGPLWWPCEPKNSRLQRQVSIFAPKIQLDSGWKGPKNLWLQCWIYPVKMTLKNQLRQSFKVV